MAKNETAAPELKPEQGKAANELKFPIAKLRDNSLKLFGVSVSTFDGATSGMTGEYSINEMKSALENWGKKEVKAHGRRNI